MSPRTGRPTDNPKYEEIKIRATKEDKKLVDKFFDRFKLGVSADTIFVTPLKTFPPIFP